MPTLIERLDAIERANDQITGVIGQFVPAIGGYGTIAHMLLEVLKGIGADVKPFEAEIAALDASIAKSQAISDEWDKIKAQRAAASVSQPAGQ